MRKESRGAGSQDKKKQGPRRGKSISLSLQEWKYSLETLITVSTIIKSIAINYIIHAVSHYTGPDTRAKVNDSPRRKPRIRFHHRGFSSSSSIPMKIEHTTPPQ
ncbi:hypothetical protein ABKN59_007313 [Abortiporus biennis]